MSVLDQQFRTVTCDSCGKTVTFDQKDVKEVLEAHPWIKTLRIVQTAQGRNFAYDSDECELKAISAGNHNPEESKKVVIPQGSNAQALAAAEAARAEAATKALKSGSGVTLER